MHWEGARAEGLTNKTIGKGNNLMTAVLETVAHNPAVLIEGTKKEW